MKKIFLKAIVAIIICLPLCLSASAEAGDSYSEAMNIEVNTLYSDNLETKSDRDVFRFELTSPGSVYLEFMRKNYNLSDYYWSADIRSFTGETIVTYHFKANESQSASHTVGLPSGSYYVYFRCYNYETAPTWGNAKYTFSVRYSSSDFTEQELNESYATSTPMYVGKTYTGSICKSTDADYYTFALSSPGAVALSFVHENLYSPEEYWRISLYNNMTEEIINVSVKGNDTGGSVAVTGLSCGKYYVVVSGGGDSRYDYAGYSYSTTDYQLTVKYKASDSWEQELNETPETATPFKFDNTVSGNISGAYDMDYYKFSINKSTNVAVFFKESVSGDELEYYTLSILDKTANTVKTYSISGNSGTSSRKISLSAGTYYIKLTGGAWYNECSHRFASNTYSFKLAVGDLGTPSKIAAVSSLNAIKLSWSAVSGATGYRVFLKTASGWKPVADTSKLTYTLKNLKTGTKYTYAVRAFRTENGKISWGKSFVYTQTATKAPSPAKVATAQNESAIKIAWSKCQGATGYRIYYKKAGKWTVKVSATTKTSHTFTSLRSGTTFALAVRPFIKTANGIVWSDPKAFYASTTLTTPVAAVASPSKGVVKLAWKAVNGAQGYQLYYSMNGSAYKHYKNYTANQLLEFKLKSGAKFTFAVRAYKIVGGKAMFSGYKPVSVTVK